MHLGVFFPSIILHNVHIDAPLTHMLQTRKDDVYGAANCQRLSV